MIYLDSGVDHGDAHTFARALFQSAPRFVEAERPGVWR
jgi:hypothetical protein